MPVLATPPPLRLLSPLPPPQSDPPPQSTVRSLQTPATTPEEPLSVSDTAAILDMLRGMDSKLDDMRGELAGVDKVQAVLVAWKQQREAVHDPDVERRMRVLEGDRHKVYGIAIALGAMAGWIAKYFGH